MRKANTSNRPSIYQTVTDRIISSLKAGVIPWEKPWNTPRFTVGPFPFAIRYLDLPQQIYHLLSLGLLASSHMLSFSSVSLLHWHISSRALHEEVANFYVGDDEKNQLTPEELLSFTIDRLPDEKLTGFALRLALTGHTDIPRENDFDFLAQAEAAFLPPQSKKAKEKKPKPSHQRDESTNEKSHTIQEEDRSADSTGAGNGSPLFLQETFRDCYETLTSGTRPGSERI